MKRIGNILDSKPEESVFDDEEARIARHEMKVDQVLRASMTEAAYEFWREDYEAGEQWALDAWEKLSRAMMEKGKPMQKPGTYVARPNRPTGVPKSLRKYMP